MRVLIYGINFSPELTGVGKYSGELAAWLAARGHEVRVVTAPPYYPDWRVGAGYAGWRYRREDWSAPGFADRGEGRGRTHGFAPMDGVYDGLIVGAGLKPAPTDGRRDEMIYRGGPACPPDRRADAVESVRVFRCPLWVPARPSGLKRLLHLASFALSSLPLVLWQVGWRPQVVLVVAPALFCAPGGWLVARLCRARAWLHIQDYEVDALFGLGIAKGGLLRRFAFATERVILRAFDRVSTISSGMLQRARQKGVDEARLIFFPNWSETARFRDVAPSPALLARLGVEPGKRVLLYSGNLGEKQGLEIVIEAAERLQARNDLDLQFLIVGEGVGKVRLVDLAQRKRLQNVSFAPLQPYEDLPALLASAACHLVVQKRGAADAVLPSKLTNILAVGGNAVITADPDTSLGQLCREFEGIAARVEPESVDALIAGIERALTMPTPNRIATDYAREFLDKEQILSRFIAEIGLPITPSAQ